MDKPAAAYDIQTEVLFPHGSHMDVAALAAGIQPWANRTLTQVNEAVVRLGVLDGDFHWHKHDGEDDRQAVIEAVASGLIGVVVSAHAPAPAEDKRLPYDEAAAGAVGLQTLLSGLLAFHHEGRVPLIDLIRSVTAAPADLLGLPAGRLAKAAPADLVLVDLNAPLVIDADKLISKSKNSPFDGRRLQGKVLRTVVDGRTVFAA